MTFEEKLRGTGKQSETFGSFQIFTFYYNLPDDFFYRLKKDFGKTIDKLANEEK
jgi:hypothetical protein